MRSELERATRNDKEQRHRISSMEIEIAQVSEALSVTSREADATKQEAQQWLRLLESMERRLKDISERHDDVRQKLSESDAKVTELQLEKDRWGSTETAAQRAAERLQGRLQGEVETLRQQREQDLKSMENMHAREKSSREDKLRKTEQTAAELTMKMELCEKQRSWEAASSENQTSMLSAEKIRLQGDVEEGQQARLRLERQVGSVRQEVGRLRTELEAANMEVREQGGHASSELTNYRAKAQLAERMLTNVREELQQSELRAGQIFADHARLQSDLNEERFRVGDE